MHMGSRYSIIYKAVISLIYLLSHSRHDSDAMDRMGILGLSSILRDNLAVNGDDRKLNENGFFAEGIRKSSYNYHEM